MEDVTLLDDDYMWELIEDTPLPTTLSFVHVEQVSRFHHARCQEIVNACVAAIRSAQDDPAYRVCPDDCYDGIATPGDDDYAQLAQYIVEQGRMCFDLFVRTPFSGWVHNIYFSKRDAIVVRPDGACLLAYLRRGVSCGNSSCYYLDVPVVDAPWSRVLAEYVADFQREQLRLVVPG